MARFARSGANNVSHKKADLCRGEELTSTLPRAFREFPQKVLVGTAQEVGLNIGQAEAVARVREGLDHGGEPGRIEVALAVAL